MLHLNVSINDAKVSHAQRIYEFLFPQRSSERRKKIGLNKPQLCDWSVAEIPFLHIWAFSYEELNRILLLAESRSFCRFEKHSHESIIRRLLILSHRWNFCLLDIPFFTLAFALEIDSSAIFECETHKNQLRQLFNGNYSNRARQFPTHTLGDGEWLSRHVNVFSFEPKKKNWKHVPRALMQESCSGVMKANQR